MIFIKNNKGFTLIELLVVVAIIGVLSSVVLASLNSARAKARDARRRVDLKQVQTALELFYNDNNSYPSTGGSGSWWGNCPTYGNHATSGATGWVPDLASTYIAILPLDPKPILPNGCYLYTSNGVNYKLLAYTTVESTVSSTDPMYDPNPRGNTYAIYTSGAVAW